MFLTCQSANAPFIATYHRRCCLSGPALPMVYDSNKTDLIGSSRAHGLVSKLLDILSPKFLLVNILLDQEAPHPF